FYTFYIVSYDSKFIIDVTFAIKHFCFIHTTTERSEFINIFVAKRTINVHYPFTNVTGHVVKTIIVRSRAKNRCSYVGIIIKRSGNTHIVTSSTNKVGYKFTVETAVVIAIANIVPIPWIYFSFSNKFLIR